MNKKHIPVYIITIVLVLILGGMPFYFLDERQQAIITQFGEPIGGPKKKAGFYFKLPFVQKVTYFDKRILEWDGDPNKIPTKEQRNIWIDITARWKISDPLKFYQSVYNESGAHSRLDDIIDASVRSMVNSHNLIEIVRTSNRDFIMGKMLGQSEQEDVEKVAIGKEAIRQKIFDLAKKTAPKYGIELIDVRIKRVSYVEAVRQTAYERMISDRKRAAEKHLSEGRGEKAKWAGKTDKELKQIESEAYKEAQKIKGKADNEAIKIYADAYNKDPQLFSFLKSLEVYKQSIKDESTLILTTESEYFKYLKNSTSE
ncbi:MAG: protease modulator HflC [Candidatus Omnitrophica bacterium]|nr:protease modulator HflC [Candidatus Omnitrophota bacterium]